MAKATLPVNFKDDIMNASMNGKRKYNLIQNTDGTYSLEDVTTYDQVGSNFGAGQINQTNAAVNAAADASKIIDDIDAIAANTQKGYIAGALALKEVNSSLGGNNLIYNESEDAYYIQHGADAALKKLGSSDMALIWNIVSHATKTAYNMDRDFYNVVYNPDFCDYANGAITIKKDCAIEFKMWPVPGNYTAQGSALKPTSALYKNGEVILTASGKAADQNSIVAMAQAGDVFKFSTKINVSGWNVYSCLVAFASQPL